MLHKVDMYLTFVKKKSRPDRVEIKFTNLNVLEIVVSFFFLEKIFIGRL